MVIGFHFFSEGTSKLRQKNWSAAPFLQSATGPLAHLANDLLEDPDGRLRLCVRRADETGFLLDDDSEGLVADETQWVIDTSLTRLLWKNYLDIAAAHFGFADEAISKEIEARFVSTTKALAAAREHHSPPSEIAALESQYKIDKAEWQSFQEQAANANQIFTDHLEQLEGWLETRRLDVLKHFGSTSRESHFDRDGPNAAQVVSEVESLHEQASSIAAGRRKQIAEWTSEVESIWDSFESQINGLAVGSQKSKKPLVLHRPFDQPDSRLQFLNRFIPWFDTIIGVLLVVGLFTRFASLAGAAFLLMIVVTQPPWIGHAQPVYFQAVELFALLLLFATCAGRVGGLDFFLARNNTPWRHE